MVATLTMGTLATLPAVAAVGTTLKVDGSTVTTGLVSTNPTLLPVPADNSVDSSDALQIAITGLDTNTVVTANAVNGKIVTALATPTVPVKATNGSTSVSVNTGTGSTVDLYVFTTLVADGTVSVTIGGNTTTYYFKGTAGALNTITLTSPATAAAGTTEKVTLAGFDVFGNAKGGATINLQVITNTSTLTAYTTETATTTTTVLGTKVVDVVIPASGTVTLVATATVATAVPGLATPVSVVIKNITVRDLLSELASVKAELVSVKAELEAEKTARAADKTAADKSLADEKAGRAADKIAADKALIDLATSNAILISDLKKAFNALAKKWNAKNPKAKVTLLK